MKRLLSQKNNRFHKKIEMLMELLLKLNKNKLSNKGYFIDLKAKTILRNYSFNFRIL